MLHFGDGGPKSLCMLRLSAIGDVCHALALVQVLQRQWPEVRITWVVGTVAAKLLRDVPGLHIITFDKTAALRGVLEVWRKLRGERFDALLHLQTSFRASLLASRIKARYTLGFDKQRSGKELQGLFTNYKVPSPDSLHVVDTFMEFAYALGVERERKPQWNVPIAQKDRQWACEQCAGQKIFLIAASASQSYRNWHAEGYAAIADYVVTLGFKVVLCGAPCTQDRVLAEGIQALSQNPLHNVVGRTSLTQLLALMAKASVLLGPDTGPVHMATMVGTPVLGLYADQNPQRTGPYRDLAFVVSVYRPLMEAQTKKSIYDLPWRTRLKDKGAMRHIRVEEVISHLQRLLAFYHLV